MSFNSNVREFHAKRNKKPGGDLQPGRLTSVMRGLNFQFRPSGSGPFSDFGQELTQSSRFDRRLFEWLEEGYKMNDKPCQATNGLDNAGIDSKMVSQL